MSNNILHRWFKDIDGLKLTPDELKFKLVERGTFFKLILDVNL